MTSSSFVAVETEDAPRSGDVMFGIAASGWAPDLAGGGVPLICTSCELDSWLILASASASSAQLEDGSRAAGATAGGEAASFAGVIVPEACLLAGADTGGVAMVFTA